MSRRFDRHGPYVPVLLVGRLADTATTLYGLTLAGVYERNAVVAALIDLLGPGGGMLVANVLSVATVVLVVEFGVAALDANGRRRERLVVELGYLPAVVTSFGAAAYNVGVIAAA